MQFNVHNLILLYAIFIYMQFNVINLMLLIHCILFCIPFNVYNYSYYVSLNHVLFSLKLLLQSVIKLLLYLNNEFLFKQN